MDTDILNHISPYYPNPHTSLLRPNEQIAMIFATNYLIDRIKADRVKAGKDPALVDAININQGACYHWTMLIYLMSDPGRVTLCSTDDFSWHAFVKIDHLYYDATNPQGVENWRDLNRNHWDHKPADFVLELTKDQFIAGWPRILSHLAFWHQVAEVTRGRMSQVLEEPSRTFTTKEGYIYFLD